MKKDNIEAVRHTLAHLLAHSVKLLYPGTLNGIGPNIEEGFYQDFDFPKNISEEDLPKIEEKMRDVLSSWSEMKGRKVDLKEAEKTFANNKYKLELAREFAGEGKELTIYSAGEFEDLCKGGHSEKPMEDINPEAFKLTRLAGAYWRGDEKNKMLTRIYGVAFTTKEEMNKYFEQQEMAKNSDHRKLGKEMDLFFISQDVGAGLPLFTPRGEKIKNALVQFMRQEELKRGYQYVSTPVLAHEELYKRSGHAAYYLENMYCTEADEEGNKFFLKPMNCPHHHMIFEQMIDSYKMLPIRLAEAGGVYRYELSGALTGLIRVRGPITQNDSHTYCSEDQLESEFNDLMDFLKETYKAFNIEDYWLRVSLPDFTKEKYAGDKAKWQAASELIINVLKKQNLPFVAEEGEAAFYGPKLDIQARSITGKEDTIATIQIDILVPEKMDIHYFDKDSKKQYPIIIHKSLLGSYERFIATLLEKSAGKLPFWLTPEQVRVLPINDKTNKYVDEITTLLSGICLNKPLKHNELRFSIDTRKENIGKKIQAARTLKIPILLIVGPRDAENKTVTLNHNGHESTVNLRDLKLTIEAIK